MAKILIVDDEQALAEVVKMQLEVSGYEVIMAHDGQTGLEVARNEGPDLIILDLMLPKLNGHQVCRMLKFDEKYKKIPIIMFTSRADKKNEEIGKEVGADAYLSKPFEPDVLLAKVKELLQD